MTAHRAIASISLALFLAGCGGGGSVSSSVSSQTSQQTPPPVSVSLSPSSQQNIDQGQSVSFTASVTNDSDNQGVAWSLSGDGCSGTACGALTTASSTTVKYNAPSSVPSAFTVSVTATAEADKSASASTPVAVAPAPVITTTSLKNGRVNTPYSSALKATGGTGSLSWNITAGSLPKGLTLNASSGLISGTPAAGGASSFTAQVIDSADTPVSTKQQLSLTIEDPNLVITTTSLPDGTQGVAYSATLEEDFGVLPLSWAVTAGSLPNGLALNASSGLISGTPTTAGSPPAFTVTVTDSSTPARSASEQLSMTINAGGPQNALLSGHYAFLLSGYDTNGVPVAVAGSFMADGSGSIQDGTEDVSHLSSGTSPALTFSGTYAVGADNRGILTITNSQGMSFVMAVALGAISSGTATKGSILEFDSGGYTMSGVIEKQDPSAFSQASLQGSYVFRFTGADSTVKRLGIVGRFTAGGSGGITEGLFDANDNGILTSAGAFTGAYPTVDLSSGRGQVTLAGVSPAPSDYAIYAVSAAKWLAISLNGPGSAGLVTGEMDAQSAGPFTLSSLSGTSVVMTESASSAASGGSHVTLGLAALDGNGNASFSFDDNDAGMLIALNLNGMYAIMDSDAGRFTLTLQGGAALTGYLLMPNQGFILAEGPDAPAGVLQAQSSGPFTTSALNASFFFRAEPFAAPPVPPPLGGPTASLPVGVMKFDGSGNVAGTEDINQSGSLVSSRPIQDTYVVASNGRVTLGSGSMILYIVSPTKAFTMSTGLLDPNPTLGSVQQ